MRSSRGGLGDIPSRDTADGPPASVRSRRVKACEQVAGRKSRPCRQRVIAAGPSLTSRDLTRNAGGRHRDRCVTACRLTTAQVELGFLGFLETALTVLRKTLRA